MRFIYAVNPRDHISPYLYDLHILPVAYRIRFKASVLAYRMMSGNAPIYLMEKVKMFQPTCNKTLRHGTGRDELMFCSDVNTYRSSTWISKVIIEWNGLPLEVRSSKSLEIFKSKLKTHYFKLAFNHLI